MKLDLADAWIKFTHTAQGSAEHEVLFWVYEEISDLVRDAPQDCWAVILEILEKTDDERVLSNLAAGPMEDLLAMHGPDFIIQVEEQARRVPKFRQMLTGVWQNFMTDDIWHRVCVACGRTKPE